MTAIYRLLLIACAALTFVAPVSYAEPTAEQFASALVTIESSIDSEGRTVAALGDSRRGTGVVIDSRGLIVTVGYLLLEASEVMVSFYNDVQLPATVMFIDSMSGLALLRISKTHTDLLPELTPVTLGESSRLAQDERVIALPAGGLEAAASVRIHSMRQFTAPWEYLLEQGIYTMPPLRNFSGAALINRDAELIGIGTLALQNITGSDEADVPGNLFIPVDLLTSRLGAMLASSSSDRDLQERPWLGLTIDELLIVTRVFEESPAMVAGIQVGDRILGIDDVHVLTRSDLYRSLWSDERPTGVSVENELTLLIARERKLISVSVNPVGRSSWLRSSRPR